MNNELDDLRVELRSLSVEQLADAMGIEKWRVYELVKKGQAPPSFKIGKTYRFPIAGVRKWFAAQATPEGS